MEDYVPMTREGFNKLKADVERMDSVEMPAIAEKIAAARSEGDLKENAEYHAQREAQGMLQAKISLLKSKLARAQIIDPSTLPRDQVCFGATVKVKDVDFGDEEEYTLVGAGEEDYDKGRILVTSPLGQGLLGKKIGETAEIPAPKGSYQLEVVGIRFDFVEGAGSRRLLTAASMLQLRDVTKSYAEPDGSRLPILDIARFDLGNGEQMALVGKSGCGKTTLLHTIAGITRADSGEIIIDGIDIARLSEAGVDKVRAAKLGYVFQTFNLLPGFTALENVLLGMTFARGRKDPKRARHLIDRVGLSHRTTHKPGALSVGEQQRVAVARALANRPSLLLADEPTANIDPRNQQKIVELIRETCREESVSLIIVTHSLEVAGQFERVDRLEEINRVIGEQAVSR